MKFNRIKKLSGDASFRYFYRKKNKRKSSIIVFCNKEKKSNLLIYDAINQILKNNKLKAPKLITENYKNNYIEIEDFGDQSVFKNLKKYTFNKLFYLKKILKLLNKLHKIKVKKTKTFLGTNYKVPSYSKEKLINESKLFLDWYLPIFIRGRKKNIIKKNLLKIFRNLLNKLNYKKKVFVHRDFHVSNIMIVKKSLGIIDSQDAVYGNIAYDLASLIDDVRFKTKVKEKNIIFNEFLRINSYLKKNKFKNDFEILSVLRNLKIIGIFTRLSKRDRKNQYLKLIPHAWELIENRLNCNVNFKDLKKILDKNFSIKNRKRI